MFNHPILKNLLGIIFLFLPFFLEILLIRVQPLSKSTLRLAIRMNMNFWMLSWRRVLQEHVIVARPQNFLFFLVPWELFPTPPLAEEKDVHHVRQVFNNHTYPEGGELTYETDGNAYLLACRSVNCGCLVSLRVNANTSAIKVLFTFERETVKKNNLYFLYFLVYFSYHKKPEQRPDWSPLRGLI